LESVLLGFFWMGRCYEQ